MSQDATCTIRGTLVRDFEMRFTPSGQALANSAVVVNERRKNDQTGKWEDGDASFFDITVWGTDAENASSSFVKGDRVIVIGELKQRSWENDAGEKRSKIEVTVKEMGPSTKWAVTRSEKVSRDGGQRQQSAPAPAAPDPTFNPFGGDDEAPF